MAGNIRIMRLIARLNVGGPARHVAWLQGGLEGMFEQLLVAGRVQAGEDDMGPQLRAQGLTWVELPGLGRSLHPVKDLWVLLRLVGIMARFRPQVVETHTAKAGTLGRLAALLYNGYAWLRGWPRARAIHTFHGHTFHGYFGPLATRFFLAVEQALAALATWRIVVLSQLQLEEILEVFRVGRREQFVILPLGVDPAMFGDQASGRTGFRAELGLGESDFLWGAVGRVAPVKDYGRLVEAAAALAADRPDLAERARFALIGGGSAEDLAGLADQASGLGVGERLILLGSRDDPGAFYPGLDALLMTSRNEGTPLAILEAGACSRPVLATQVGGIPDLLGESLEDLGGGLLRRERGLTVPPGDPAALARGMAWLMDHPDAARDLGAALAAYVAREHSLERLLEDAARLYRAAATS